MVFQKLTFLLDLASNSVTLLMQSMTMSPSIYIYALSPNLVHWWSLSVNILIAWRVKVAQLHPTLCDPLYSPWNPAGQNTRVGSRSLHQGIFPTQGLNSSLPHCRQILYQLSHQGSPIAWKIFIPYWMSVYVCLCVCAPAHLCTCGVHMASIWFRFVLFYFRNFYPFSYTHTAAYGIMWFLELKNLKNDLIL